MSNSSPLDVIVGVLMGFGLTLRRLNSLEKWSANSSTSRGRGQSRGATPALFVPVNATRGRGHGRPRRTGEEHHPFRM
ncbi:hypothetical protein L6452_05673 [Arctium lappa]|uniref:Uncharacterized protein n=1 Tax=Arctium lappa TaxID=4217 RepID=A0ACB9EGG6_ARCLA|nr:hypothetical protein L6452_05673 [Arctium lappa]